MVYSSCVRSYLLHGSETWPVRRENELALLTAEMRMVRLMCDVKWSACLIAFCVVSLCLLRGSL